VVRADIRFPRRKRRRHILNCVPRFHALISATEEVSEHHALELWVRDSEHKSHVFKPRACYLEFAAEARDAALTRLEPGATIDL